MRWWSDGKIHPATHISRLLGRFPILKVWIFGWVSGTTGHENPFPQMVRYRRLGEWLTTSTNECNTTAAYAGLSRSVPCATQNQSTLVRFVSWGILAKLGWCTGYLVLGQGRQIYSILGQEERREAMESDACLGT